MPPEVPARREKFGLSVVFPAYNDAGTIPSMILGARLAARRIVDDLEIVVVNDGSSDHTDEVLAELESVVPELKVVHHPVNRGYGGALRTGFQNATKELVFYTDGDAQYDPREMALLFESWESTSDFVNGVKIGRSDPLHRLIIGRIYHWAVRIAFGLSLSDVDCDFRLFRRSIFDKVVLTKDSGVICVELMKKVQDHGFRIQEVPVHHFHRVYGRSQFFNFPRVARTLLDLSRLWYDLVVRKAHLAEPARVESHARRRATPKAPFADGATEPNRVSREPENYSEAFEGKKVLITGGLGFIGSNLARALVPLGAEVLLVDSLIPDYGGNLYNIHGIESQLKVNVADVRDANGIRYLVGNQDYLFNLAGQVSHIDSIEDPMTDLEINCTSQLSILEACRRVNPRVRIVFASTRQIYGKPVSLPADENHPIHPTDVNGINKASGEMYNQIYHQVHGLLTTSLRLTNTYGPRQLMKHNRQGFAGWFVRQVVMGEDILLFGDGEQKRDFNYVDDVVRAFLIAATAEAAVGETYNLGAKPPTSLKDFLELLYEVAGRKADYTLVPFPEERRKIDIGDFYTDYSRIESRLGWSPQTSLREGLSRTVAYYRENMEHYLS